MNERQNENPCKELEALRRKLAVERECYDHADSSHGREMVLREIERIEARIKELEDNFELNPSCGGCDQCLERMR